MNATGEVFISGTVLRGRFTLHLAVGNHQTTAAHILRAWELIVPRVPRRCAVDPPHPPL